jgi:putative endonuclease
MVQIYDFSFTIDDRMTDKIKTGKEGEDVAAEFLTQKGYSVLERNYRYKHAEIDLIVKKGSFIVFVEVKTRSYSFYGEPEAFVDSKKASTVIRAAEQYTYENKYEGNIRFDIVSVKTGADPEIVHFEDAFY